MTTNIIYLACIVWSLMGVGVAYHLVSKWHAELKREKKESRERYGT